MNTLHDSFMEGLSDLPRLVGLQIVTEKLQSLGIYTEARAESLLAALLSDDEDAKWDDDDLPDDLVISFDDADLDRINELSERVFAGLDGFVLDTVRKITPNMVARYRKEWRAYRPYQLWEYEQFKHRVEERWGKGFDALRMLLAHCRDQGAAYAERCRKSQAKRDRHLREALVALHLRGCQIAAEIICLMENGYADGAMARWRTLYELTVVAILTKDQADKLAERYLAHFEVEQYRALCVERENGPLMGHTPPTDKEMAAAKKARDAVVSKFGQAFAQPYGWATDVAPGNPNPNFTHLEKAAGNAAMRALYKFASYNVHAGPSGIAIRLSTKHGPHVMCAGASNTGFLEPGINTAYNLVQLTGLLPQGRLTIDKMALMQALVIMRHAVTPALQKADQKLYREERQIAKATSAKSARKTSRVNRKVK